MSEQLILPPPHLIIPYVLTSICTSNISCLDTKFEWSEEKRHSIMNITWRWWLTTKQGAYKRTEAWISTISVLKRNEYNFVRFCRWLKGRRCLWGCNTKPLSVSMYATNISACVCVPIIPEVSFFFNCSSIKRGLIQSRGKCCVYT